MQTPSGESAEPKIHAFSSRLLSNRPPHYHPTNSMEGFICFSLSADARSLAGNRRALGTTTSVNAFPSQFQLFPKYKIWAGIPCHRSMLPPGKLGEGGRVVVPVLPFHYLFGNKGCFYLIVLLNTMMV